ncbi:MAG: hypothetical protein ACE5DM_05180 [Candidatus Nanoarchaeia archaeon]
MAKKRNKKEIHTSRDEKGDRIALVFDSLAEILIKNGDVESYRLRRGSDIHAFYQMAGQSKMIHMQGYPGMSDEEEMTLWGRVVSCEDTPDDSFDSEVKLKTLDRQPRMPYDPSVLAAELYGDLSQTRYERSSGEYPKALPTEEAA